MSRKFIGFLLGAFILLGGFFFWTLYRGLVLPAPEEIAPAPAASAPPVAPPPPSITFTIRTSRAGNMFIIECQNLPAGTIALNILRKLRKSAAPWILWKQIPLSVDELASCHISLAIGSYTFANYSFTAETVGNLTGSSGNITGQTITWTSSPTTAAIMASSTTTTATNTNQTNTANANTSTSTTTNTTSTANTTTTASTTTAATNTATNTTTNTAPAPTGTPYYTPQIQISGYGSGQTGSFWVEYVDQKIEIGWQNLPTSTNEIAILRAPSANGPWTTILTQMNVDPTGPSTIQIVDDTLNQTSYYELNAENSGTVIAAYGPVALPPAP